VAHQAAVSEAGAVRDFRREGSFPSGRVGLRGTHSTIAQEAGATSHLVARQLGHESVKTTHESYTAPGTVERQERKAALKVLTGGKRRG